MYEALDTTRESSGTLDLNANRKINHIHKFLLICINALCCVVLCCVVLCCVVLCCVVLCCVVLCCVCSFL